MDKNTKKVPSIRFNKFIEDWQQCKLDSIFGNIRNAFVGTATPYYVKNGHFYLESNNVKHGQINRNTEVFINDEFHEKQRDKWLHTGDLVMVQSGHVGHTAVITAELDGTAAHALIMFSDYKEKANPYFLNYQFQTSKSKKHLKFITTGNTIKHILSSEMKKFEVKLPSHPEQTKIGNLFKLLEEIITLQQQLLNDHKQLKKAMLQKMFPKKGKSVPEIRFDGFNGNWKKINLGKLVEINSGINGNVSLNNGKYKLTRIETISNGKVNFNKVGFTNELPERKYLLNKGDILYSNINSLAHIGKIAKYNLNYELYHGINLLRLSPKHILNSDFLYQYLNTVVAKQWAVAHANQAVNQASINQTELSKQSVHISNYEEQTKIGDFFKQLDETIELHQARLETYQELKKAMLQKMFV